MWEFVCEGGGSASSSSIECPDKEAMGGEYMRLLDALPSLRGACSMYQRQAPGTMENKQRPSSLRIPLFAYPFLRQTPSTVLCRLPVVDFPLH